MKINELILKQLIEIPQNIEEITNQHIVETESFIPARNNDLLVIGHVLTCIDHPDSDHLHVTTVDLGNKHIEQIVCGAHNVKAGQYVIVAKVGCKLSDDFIIKEAKIRGVESKGMICSLSELGYSEKYIPEAYKKGIYVLADSVEPGTPASDVLGLNAFSMELALTPNRGDLLSHLGFAYDLSAVTGKDVKLPSHTYVLDKTKKSDLAVSINTKGCLLYQAAKLDVAIKASPEWLKAALILSGIKPVNNVVDITNYVLLMMGTPLHAFDAEKVGNTIIIRDGLEQEKVEALDENTYEVSAEDVIVSNEKGAIAIAGVMGLKDSKVTDDTQTIVLEAALFDKERIQKTSKKLQLRTDASLRFERGIDMNRVNMGFELALHMLEKYAEARIYDHNVQQVNGVQEQAKAIETSLQSINSKLGLQLTEAELEAMFLRYRYRYDKKDKIYGISVPSDRLDLKIEADIVEEIARLYGLDAIPSQLLSSQSIGHRTDKQRIIRHIRHYLAHLGLNEAVNYSLLSSSDVHTFSYLGEPVHVLRPLSDERTTLRQSLINGLRDNAVYNVSRRQNDCHFFEIGHVFAKDIEENHLGIFMHGIFEKQTWSHTVKTADFFVLKGVLEQLFETLLMDVSFEATKTYRLLHPARQALIYYQGHVIGFMGQLHPSLNKAYKLQDAYVAEIFLDRLPQMDHVKFQAISKFPTVERDLAIVINREVEVSKIEFLVRQTARKWLTHFEIFDIFEDKKLGDAMKSVAFKMIFSDPEKTLESQDIDQIMKKILNRLQFELKANIRQ